MTKYIKIIFNIWIGASPAIAGIYIYNWKWWALVFPTILLFTLINITSDKN